MAREKRMPGNVGGGRRGGAFEKPKGKPSAILIRLWKYLYHYKWMLLLAATLSIGGNLLALVGPKLSGFAIDAIEPGPGQVIFRLSFTTPD